MKQIRLNVFETNSSSTHSLVMAEDSLFQKWIRGELFYVDDSWRSDLKNKQFLNKEEFFEVAKKYYSRRRKCTAGQTKIQQRRAGF